jgi:hypothetical protein
LICSFLDSHYSDENWKLELQNETKTSLFRNVLPFLSMSDTHLQSRGRAIIASSEGDLVRTEASGMISQYLSAIKTVRNQITASTFQITVFSQSSRECFGGGGSESTYYLPEGGILSINYSGSLKCGTEYQEFFNNIPVLERDKKFSFFGAEKIKIWIDSSELAQLRDGTYPFTNIKIEGDLFSVQSSRSGALSISGPLVSVRFSENNNH